MNSHSHVFKLSHFHTKRQYLYEKRWRPSLISKVFVTTQPRLPVKVYFCNVINLASYDTSSPIFITHIKQVKVKDMFLIIKQCDI